MCNKNKKIDITIIYKVYANLCLFLITYDKKLVCTLMCPCALCADQQRPESCLSVSSWSGKTHRTASLRPAKRKREQTWVREWATNQSNGHQLKLLTHTTSVYGNCRAFIMQQETTPRDYMEESITPLGFMTPVQSCLSVMFTLHYVMQMHLPHSFK